MKKAILVATIGAMTLGVNAGDWGKAPVGKAPIEECYDIGGQISAGYMTDYYFHGVHAALDSVWVDVNYTFDNLAVPVTIGVNYLNGIHPDYYDHLQVYASAALGTFFGFETSVGYTHHFFPEYGSDYSFGELGLQLRRDLGFATLLLGTNYMLDNRGNFSDGGWFHEAGLERAFPLTDNVSLVLAGGLGYLDGEIDLPSAYQYGSGVNHYYLRLSLPIELNCRATVTPYVGYIWQKSVGDDAQYSYITDNYYFDDNLHGGVTITVNF